MGVTYRGKHSDEFGLAVKTNPHMLPDFENNTESIPGMDGEYYRSTEYGMRIIPLEIGFVSDGLNDYEKRLKALSSWLRPDHGVGAFVSDNDPDITYHAVLSSQDLSRVDDIARMGEGSLELICPDPFGYGKYKTQNISGTTTVANEGTTETYPVFDLTVKRKTSLISIKNYDNQDEEGNPTVMELGEESEVNDEKVDTKKLVLHDTMQSTSNWTDASSVDNGDISGSIVTDEDGFYAEKWGDENSDYIPPEDRDYDKDYDKNVSDPYVRNSSLGDWIGPSLQRSLDNAIEGSFMVDAYIENQNDINPDGSDVGEEHIGIIEVYMRDINDNMICKLQFGDTYDNKSENKAAFEKGEIGQMGQKRFDYKRKGWNDFDGIFRVLRDTDYYHLTIATVDKNGQFGKILQPSKVFIDKQTVAANPLKTIQVALRKWNGSLRMFSRMKELRAYDTVGAFDYPDNSVSVEFHKDDKLKIDMTKNKILLNGEPRPDLLTFDARYFSLVEGLNELKLSDNVEGTVTFRNRYL